MKGEGGGKEDGPGRDPVKTAETLTAGSLRPWIRVYLAARRGRGENAVRRILYEVSDATIVPSTVEGSTVSGGDIKVLFFFLGIIGRRKCSSKDTNAIIGN